MMPGAEDQVLFGKISEYLQGYFDVEDVKSDPEYSKTGDFVKPMISGFQKGTGTNRDIEKFMNESLKEEGPEAKIIQEIGQIRKEIKSNGINNISEEWVKEWHEKKRRDQLNDKKTNEIRDFVTGSLELAKNMTEINSKPGQNKSGTGRIRIISYISLAAASIIGVVFLVRSLIPSHDPDKIFSEYYEPYDAVLSVTRSPEKPGTESLRSALGSYKSANYQAAAAGFSAAILSEGVSDSRMFYLGISQIELKDFNTAINLLELVAQGQSEFAKEATWYLGLVCLKTGNKAKASGCFEILAQTPGYYRDRSEKILRLLK
jgi:TolA-binding protein